MNTLAIAFLIVGSFTLGFWLGGKNMAAKFARLPNDLKKSEDALQEAIKSDKKMRDCPACYSASVRQDGHCCRCGHITLDEI